jgi:hypothetical protein
VEQLRHGVPNQVRAENVLRSSAKPRVAGYVPETTYAAKM